MLPVLCYNHKIAMLKRSPGYLTLLTDKGLLWDELFKCNSLSILFHLCRQINLIQEVKFVQNIHKISESAQKK